MRPVIQSVKHYIQRNLTPVAAGVLVITSLVNAKQIVGTAAEDCKVGSIIKAVYVEFWIKGNNALGGSYHFAITKNEGGANLLTNTTISNLHDYNNKKNVYYFSQGTTNDIASIGTPAFRGWLKIPKSKQRFGEGDQLNISCHAASVNLNFCMFATYKEYS